MVKDKYALMSLKTAMAQLASLGCKNVRQTRARGSEVIFEYNGFKNVTGDARDLLREISEEVVKANASIEWF